MYSFEYDDKKSESNFIKHGINFIDSQILWDDPNILEVKTKYEAETRYIVIGKINTKHWSAVITYRGEIIRIISIRRSREAEVNLYESY